MCCQLRKGPQCIVTRVCQILNIGCFVEQITAVNIINRHFVELINIVQLKHKNAVEFQTSPNNKCYPNFNNKPYPKPNLTIQTLRQNAQTLMALNCQVLFSGQIVDSTKKL